MRSDDRVHCGHGRMPAAKLRTMGYRQTYYCEPAAGRARLRYKQCAGCDLHGAEPAIHASCHWMGTGLYVRSSLFNIGPSKFARVQR